MIFHDEGGVGKKVIFHDEGGDDIICEQPLITFKYTIFQNVKSAQELRLCSFDQLKTLKVWVVWVCEGVPGPDHHPGLAALLHDPLGTGPLQVLQLQHVSYQGDLGGHCQHQDQFNSIQFKSQSSIT